MAIDTSGMPLNEVQHKAASAIMNGTGVQPSSQAISVVDATRTVKGYQQITSLSAATALTVPNGSKLAVIACESQPVRWRDDGTNPTASVGMELLVGQALEYDGDLSAIKFIEEAASAKLNVSYYA